MYMMKCTKMQKMKKKMCDECVQRVLVTRNLCEVRNVSDAPYLYAMSQRMENIMTLY